MEETVEAFRTGNYERYLMNKLAALKQQLHPNYTRNTYISNIPAKYPHSYSQNSTPNMPTALQSNTGITNVNNSYNFKDDIDNKYISNTTSFNKSLQDQ